MVERNQVLERYRVKGQSKRQIAEEMGISRHTVDKIVWEYERKCLDANGDCDMDALYRLMGSEPKFRTPERSCPVVTDEIKGIIRKYLEENRVRRATGMRKLQWTCKGILRAAQRVAVCPAGYAVADGGPSQLLLRDTGSSSDNGV